MEFEVQHQLEWEDFDLFQQVVRQSKTGWKRYKSPVIRGAVFLVGLLLVIKGLLMEGYSGDKFFIPGGALMLYSYLWGAFISTANKRMFESYKEPGNWRFQEDGIFQSNEVVSSEFRYEGIQAIFHKKERYFLRMDERRFIVLPERNFTTGDPVQFADFIQQKTGLTVQYLK